MAVKTISIDLAYKSNVAGLKDFSTTKERD